MEQLAQQWPLLAGFLSINAILLKIIRDLYERDRKEQKERADRLEALLLRNLTTTDRIAGAAETVVRSGGA